MDIASQVINLIDEKKFDEAKLIIESRIQINPKDITAKYCYAVWYFSYGNPCRDKQIAKKFLMDVINSNSPIENAYCLCAQLEDNRGQKNRILKRGLDVFPTSEMIYSDLLLYIPDEEISSLFTEIDQKGLVFDALFESKASYHIRRREFDEALKVINLITSLGRESNGVYQLAKAFCSYELGITDEAEIIFDQLISIDLKHQLQYAQYFGKSLCLQAKSEFTRAEMVFSEIPSDFDHEFYCLFEMYSRFIFDYETYVRRCADAIIKNASNRQISARARVVKNFTQMMRKYDQNESFSVKELKEMEVICAIHPQNSELLLILIFEYAKKGDLERCLLCATKYLTTLKDQSASDLPIDEDFYQQFTDEQIQKGLQFYTREIDSSDYSTRTSIRNILLSDFIRFITYKKKNYSATIELLKRIDIEALFRTGCEFELAYANDMAGEKVKAQFLYQEIIKKEDNFAAFHNLGVILEAQGKVVEAIEKFEKALDIKPSSESTAKLLAKARTAIRELEILAAEDKEIAASFMEEGIWLQQRILKFSSFEDSNELITCSYRRLPQMLGVVQAKASDIIQDLIEKGYVSRVKDHSLNTSSSVYRINPEIRKRLHEIEITAKRETELLSVIERFSTKTLDEIGMTEFIQACSKKVNSEELQKSLDRDIRENAYALICRSYKSALIMSGSIVEAFLFDLLSSKGITSHPVENGKAIDTDRMDLNQLLFVSKSLGLISDDVFHLAHVLRGYRNLIHPGVEIRRKAIQLNENTAKLAWDIAKKIFIDAAI